MVRVLRALRRAAVASVGAGVGLGAGAVLYTRNAQEEYMALSEGGLPLTYQPDQIAAFWDQRPSIALRRVGEIGAAVLPFCAQLAGDWMLRSGDDTTQRDARLAARAKQLRLLLTELGPTFIKFGQMLSIRPDVIPPAALAELQKLCDAVPSYPTGQALELIRRELGQQASEFLLDLDASIEPIAAASLGQVYRCRLRSSGELVALKVQRPDMLRAVSLDLYLLRGYMQFVEAFKKKVLTGVFGAADRTSFDVKLLDTFATGMCPSL